MRKVLAILGQLNDEDIDWMVGAGQRLDCAPGEVLIALNQPVTKLFILLQGEVAVLAPNGSELARLGQGELLGEMSLIDKAPPSASVHVITPTVFLALDQAMLQRHMEAEPGFGWRMYRAIASFLSMRMRMTIANLGYGKASTSLEEEVEIDENILDQLHLAGARFERMLAILR